MHESRGASPADTAAAETLGATLAYRVHDEMLGVTEVARVITFVGDSDPLSSVPNHPLWMDACPTPQDASVVGRRCQARAHALDHAKLKAKRKRGRKGRGR